MVKVKKEQKKFFADKFIDLAHLIFAGLVIGQFISDRPFSFELATLGIIFVVLLYFAGYNLTK